MRIGCILLATLLLVGCATTGGCSRQGTGAVIVSALSTAGLIASTILTRNAVFGHWAFLGTGGTRCVAPVNDPPLNAGHSPGPDRPTVPEPGGYEPF